MKRLSMFMVLVLTIIVVGMAQAQPPAEGDADCPALVETAITAVGEACAGVGRNSVCYGHFNVAALGADETPLADFAESGDTVRVDDLAALQTAAMNVDEGVWGVALMSLQANIPDTLPGQAVTFVLFGDASLEADPDGGADFAAPMQAFRFSTGIGEPACAEAPNDGVLIQSPEGTTVNFLVNGIEVEIGSTALLDIRQDSKLWVSNLEGSVVVTSDGVSQQVEPGYKVLTEPGGVPHGYDVYTFGDVEDVPLSLLPRPITLPFTLSAKAADWVDSGIFVTDETLFTVSAEGTMNLVPGCTDDAVAAFGYACADLTFSPNGMHSLGARPDDGAPLPYGAAGALIARVVDADGEAGAPIFIGVGGKDLLASADRDGTLQFRTNLVESALYEGATADDNTGGFVILVENAGVGQED